MRWPPRHTTRRQAAGRRGSRATWPADAGGRGRPCATLLQGQHATGRASMSPALFTVKATVDAADEARFNEWYNHEHIPDVLKFKGVVSARRYRAILPEDRFQYVAMYEFESEATLRAFLDSEHFAWLKREFDAQFSTCERQRAAYVQVWP